MEANGGGGGLDDHGLFIGGGEALADGGGGEALGNGGADGVANGLGALDMEAGGFGNGGALQAVDVAPSAVVPAPAETYSIVYPSLLCLPVEDVVRCGAVCRFWREITASDVFRREHHSHRTRARMPLVFSPDLPRVRLRAVDTRDRVFRRVCSFPGQHLQGLLIHGSSAGILLLSFGDRLCAFNPFTRHWAHLPPLHIQNRIVGFFATGLDPMGGLRCRVLYHDLREDGRDFWVFELGGAHPARCIGLPGDGMASVLTVPNGLAPSCTTPPVVNANGLFLFWLPHATRVNPNLLRFDTAAETFSLVAAPRIEVNGELITVGVGGQLFIINGELALGAILSPGRVDVWVRSNSTSLWTHRYRVRLPVHIINTSGGYHLNGVLAASLLAIPEGALILCPGVLLQRPAIGDFLHTYQLGEQWALLSPHNIQESLLLLPNILPLNEVDAADGDPPFFHNNN